jgi:hypothetical protein
MRANLFAGISPRSRVNMPITKACFLAIKNLGAAGVRPGHPVTLSVRERHFPKLGDTPFEKARDRCAVMPP